MTDSKERLFSHSDKNPIEEFVEEKGHIMIFESYVEGLPEQFQSAEGLQVIRTGAISIFPRTENGAPIIGGLFAYDPKRGEARIIHTGNDRILHVLVREQLIQEGWTPVLSSADRVIVHREFTNNTGEK